VLSVLHDQPTAARMGGSVAHGEGTLILFESEFLHVQTAFIHAVSNLVLFACALNVARLYSILCVAKPHRLIQTHILRVVWTLLLFCGKGL
jgi:hypothetical protein